MMRVLLLGGTTEASQIANAMAHAGIAGVFSYAGRTASRIVQPLPTRVGGFGGIDGLIAYLRQEKITHVIDATHPFAVQMSRNAIRACKEVGTPLLAFERPAWEPVAGDNWRHVTDIETAVATLPDEPTRVFLAIGRQNIAAFAAKPQHFYLLRMVDWPDTPAPFPHTAVVLARGPFTAEADLALLKRHGIAIVVAKNAGGSGARAKLDAARTLGLPIIMIDRPKLPERRTAQSIEAVLIWLGHSPRLGV